MLCGSSFVQHFPQKGDTPQSEQILVGRVLERLMKLEMLDLGQFRALPKGGVTAPLRIMAEIMEDARRSGQELHMMVADLSKAFGTME